MEQRKPIIIKTYKGNEEISRRVFNHDKIAMQKQGYYPVSINYTPGSWGFGSFLIAALLVLILIGIIVFIYMIIVKPAGYLTVTYKLREKEKICPMCAEKVKYEAKICKHCGYELPPNPIIKNEIKNEAIPNKTFIKSTDIKNNEGTLIAIIIVVIVALMFFFNMFKNTISLWGESEQSEYVSYWRSPEQSEYKGIKKTLIIYNKLDYERIKVKKINDHQFILACTNNFSDWVYYDVDTEKEKLYHLDTKTKEKLKPPR